MKAIICAKVVTPGEPMAACCHEALETENIKNIYAEAWDEMGKYAAGNCFKVCLCTMNWQLSTMQVSNGIK